MGGWVRRGVDVFKGQVLRLLFNKATAPKGRLGCKRSRGFGVAGVLKGKRNTLTNQGVEEGGISKDSCGEQPRRLDIDIEL